MERWKLQGRIRRKCWQTKQNTVTDRECLCLDKAARKKKISESKEYANTSQFWATNTKRKKGIQISQKTIPKNYKIT